MPSARFEPTYAAMLGAVGPVAFGPYDALDQTAGPGPARHRIGDQALTAVLPARRYDTAHDPIPSTVDPPPPPMMRKLFAVLRDLDITDGDDRLHLASLTLGRNVTTFKQLTHWDTCRLLDALTAYGLICWTTSHHQTRPGRE